jgi:TonB family protein
MGALGGRLAPFRACILGAALLGVLPARAQERSPSVAPPLAPAAAVVPPKLVGEAAVAYPEGASGDATVVLTLTIGPDGSVREAVPVLEVEPFSSAAVAAARAWHFEPATRSGAPVAAKIRFEVAFHAPAPEVPPPPPEENPYGPPPEPPKPPPAPHEIIIRGERAEPSRSVTLSRAEVRQIPGTFGDPFRAIEIMPGVTPIISGLPFFFVRGAPPGDVGYFLDGIRVPLLFHVGVGPSVVHPAIMDRVDLYPGGYPARFGRFSGGIVAGETAEPSPLLHGEYNARLYDAGALVEAPFAEGRGTVLAGGRYSYTAALLTQLSSDTELDYWDYQARATYDVTRDDRVSVFAFGSYDYLGQITPTQTLTLFSTEFHRVDLRYDRHLDEDGTLRVAVTGGVDRSLVPGDRALRDRLLGVRSELKYRLSPSALLRAGMDAQLDSYDIALNQAGLSASQISAAALFPSREDLALGQRTDLVLGLTPELEVTPGLRFDFYGSQGHTALAVDPRLATRLKVTDRTTLLSAMGIAHQPPAFVVPLPGFQPGGLKGGLQQAVQESLGLEFDLGDATTFTATGFHNAFFNMSDPLGTTAPQINGCPPGSFPTDNVPGDRGANPMGGGSCAPRFIPGQAGPDRSGGGGQAADSQGAARAATALEVRTMGTSYGLELFLKRRLTSRFGGFLSYTLSRSQRSFETRQFTATFDRTHVANAAIAYDLGRHWRAGTRVTFYTGLPKAPDPTDSSTRLPPFFRVDLRLEKRWQLGERTWISFVAEWMNATLSKEAVATSCTLQGCTTQTIGPVTIPSLGVEGGF